MWKTEGIPLGPAVRVIPVNMLICIDWAWVWAKASWIRGRWFTHANSRETHRTHEISRFLTALHVHALLQCMQLEHVGVTYLFPRARRWLALIWRPTSATEVAPMSCSLTTQHNVEAMMNRDPLSTASGTRFCTQGRQRHHCIMLVIERKHMTGRDPPVPRRMD